MNSGLTIHDRVDTISTRTQLRLHIAGRGGEGNITLGEVLGKVLARRGYHVFSFRTYPAEIEGGVAQIVLQISTTPLLSLGTGSELACVLTQDAFAEVRSELRPDGFVLYDQVVRKIDPFAGHAIEATKIARWTYGNPKLKNLVALGALSALLGLDTDEVIAAARERMRKVDGDLLAKCVRHGATMAPDTARFRLAPAQDAPQLILSGNQAIGFGAVRAGCDYVAGYPITPASPCSNISPARCPLWAALCCRPKMKWLPSAPALAQATPVAKHSRRPPAPGSR